MLGADWTPAEFARRRWVEECSFPVLANLHQGQDEQPRRWAQDTQRLLSLGRYYPRYGCSKWRNRHKDATPALLVARYRQDLLGAPHCSRCCSNSLARCLAAGLRHSPVMATCC